MESFIHYLNFKVGVEGTEEHIKTVHAIAEDKYFEEAHGLYIDSFSRDFKTASPYRGQNANMHMCEAQIALFEALGQIPYLERATGIAHRLVVELPTKAGKEQFLSCWTDRHHLADFQVN